jgi:hypothetical protein
LTALSDRLRRIIGQPQPQPQPQPEPEPPNCATELTTLRPVDNKLATLGSVSSESLVDVRNDRCRSKPSPSANLIGVISAFEPM